MKTKLVKSKEKSQIENFVPFFSFFHQTIENDEQRSHTWTDTQINTHIEERAISLCVAKKAIF